MKEDLERYIADLKGAPFKVADVAKALPHLTRSYIRNRLFWMVRAEKLWAVPEGWAYVYRAAYKPGAEELPANFVDAYPGACAVDAWSKIAKLPRAPEEGATEAAGETGEPGLMPGKAPLLALALEPSPAFA